MKGIKDLTPSDLSNFDSPVSDMFKQPQTHEEWKQYLLTEDQIKFYEENGFLSGIKILTKEQVDILNSELEQLQKVSDEKRKLFYHYQSNESEDPNTVLFHAIGGWRITPGFHDLWWSPAYRMAVYQLMGGDYRAFHDQLFCKPARHGGVVAWHQDFSYWTFTKPMNHLTCWIGLDDASTENGCLYYVPGSHKWGLLPITGLTGEMDAVREVLDEKQKHSFDSMVANELPKGYCSFHHPLTMHGSYANLSERSRRAIVLNTMGTKTVSNYNDYKRKEALENFPALGETGTALNSRHFPILFEASNELGNMLKDIPVASV